LAGVRPASLARSQLAAKTALPRSLIAATVLLLGSFVFVFAAPPKPLRHPLLQTPADIATDALLRVPPGSADADSFVPAPLTAAEVAVLYPPHLRLVLVQAVHRHGERTPTAPHFPSIPEHTDGWRLCRSSRSQALFFVSSNATDPQPFRIVPLGPDNRPDTNISGACDYGQLTDKGKRTLRRVGAFVRHLYVQHLRFLPSTWSDPSLCFVRVTDIVRTHHSALSLLHGLYPPSTRGPRLPAAALHTMPPGQEYLYPNDRCPRQHHLWAQNLKADSGFLAALQKFEADNPVIQRWMAQAPPSKHPDRWEVSRLQAVHDTFMTYVAHGVPLPDGVTAEAFEALKAITTREQYRPYNGATELNRLASGRLLGDLAARIDAAVAGTGPRLVEYSVHDSTVGPLLSALQCWDGRWPPFGALVLLELMSKASEDSKAPVLDAGEKGSYFVRVLYNGRPLPMPAACPESREPPHTCPLAAFRRLIEPLVLTSAQHAIECARE